MFIVLAFGVLLEHNFSKKYEGLRALGELRLTVHERVRLEDVLQGFEERGLTLAEREEMSLTWSWGARKALAEASSFYGESLDTVSAGALVSLALCRHCRVYDLANRRSHCTSSSVGG